jgi:hypothetical protein
VLPPTKTDLPVRAVRFLKKINRQASLSSIDPKATSIKASRPTEHIEMWRSLLVFQTEGPEAREVFRPTSMDAATSVRRVHLEN